MKAVLASIILVAAQGGADKQFDLECSGKTLKNGKVARQHLQIDLQRREWCGNSCGLGIKPIREVSSGRLVLMRPDLDTGWWYVVDRVAGTASIYIDGGFSVDSYQCKKEKFTPFPQQQF